MRWCVLRFRWPVVVATTGVGFPLGEDMRAWLPVTDQTTGPKITLLSSHINIQNLSTVILIQNSQDNYINSLIKPFRFSTYNKVFYHYRLAVNWKVKVLQKETLRS